MQTGWLIKHVCGCERTIVGKDGNFALLPAGYLYGISIDIR